jgi:hypothetical protein
MTIAGRCTARATNVEDSCRRGARLCSGQPKAAGQPVRREEGLPVHRDYLPDGPVRHGALRVCLADVLHRAIRALHPARCSDNDQSRTVGVKARLCDDAGIVPRKAGRGPRRARPLVDQVLPVSPTCYWYIVGLRQVLHVVCVNL